MSSYQRRLNSHPFGLFWGFLAILWCNWVTLKVAAVEYYTERPSFLPACRIYEPEFTKCSTKSIQNLLDQLNIGIPEFTAKMGAFDPLHFRDVEFQQESSQVANIRANLTKVVVHGLSNIKIKEARVSKKDFSWQTTMFIPKLRMDAIYKMQGRLLLFPLNGSGKMFLELENLGILMLTKTQLYEKGGFTFYNATTLKVKLNMTRVRTQFDNLLNGQSKEIERSTNQFFNDNWQDFYEALKPMVVDTVQNVLKEIISTVFELLPANFFVEDILTPQQLYEKVPK